MPRRRDLPPLALPAVVALALTSAGSAFRATVPRTVHPRSSTSPPPPPRLAPLPPVPPPCLPLASVAPDREDAPLFVPGSEFTLTWEPDVALAIRDMVPPTSAAAAAEGVDGSDRPFLIGLVGIPGSGKSTSSSILSDLLSQPDGAAGTLGIPNVVMPMDGYHHPLSHLSTFPDPKDAVYRRGAPDTFDSAALLRDLRRIKYGSEAVVRVPGFDHAKGDPEPDAHAFVRSEHRVVICEGLYLLHDGDGWEEVADEFDLTVCIDSCVDLCVERLKVRNRCIPGYTPEEIDARCDVVDRANAHTVLRAKDRAHVVVESAAGYIV